VLSLKDARELAKGKGRWQIEINGFKQANQLFGTKTKHVYKNSYKSEQRMFNYLGAKILGYNVFAQVRMMMDEEENRCKCNKKCNNAKLILKGIQEGLKEIVNDKLYKGEKVRIVEDSS
jgi:hypothetical protein